MKTYICLQTVGLGHLGKHLKWPGPVTICVTAFIYEVSEYRDTTIPCCESEAYIGMDTLLKGESTDLPYMYAIVLAISIFSIIARKNHAFQRHIGHMPK